MSKPPRPVEQRFQEHITFPNSLDDCWIWHGPTMKNGYGYMSVGSKCDGSRKKILAHRLSYFLHYGEMPHSNIDICHNCDVRDCVNPVHLFAGSRTDNMRDAQRKRRLGGQNKTHCKNGHEFTPDNTYISRNTQRHCRSCAINRAQLHRRNAKRNSNV